MRTARWRFIGLGAVAAAMGVALFVQREALAQLRSERDAARAEAGELAALQATNRRLTAAEIPAAELNALRADHAALARLREEIGSLQQRTRVAAAPLQPQRPKQVPASEWRNAGRATPVTTVETALWAAAGGNVEMLADAIHLEGAAREKAEAILARLPDATRAQYSTPERFVALFTAKDIPIDGNMVMIEQKAQGADDASVTVVLQSEVKTGPDGRQGRTSRGQVLSLHRHPDGWKLMVPESAVEKYGERLKAPAAPEK